MQRDVSDLQSELQKIRNQQLNENGASPAASLTASCRTLLRMRMRSPTLWRLDYVRPRAKRPARLATRSTQLMVLSSRPR